MSIFSPVEVPLWLFALVSIFALLALAERILAPAFKAIFRRQSGDTNKPLNTHLKLRDHSFRTTSRQELIEKILHSQEVIEAIEMHAMDQEMTLDSAKDEAEVYSREIVPDFTKSYRHTLAHFFARYLANSLYRIQSGYSDADALRAVNPDSTIIFVANHRSVMDYILTTFLSIPNSSLSFAVGEWGRIWPLKSIISSIGAYFIRANSENILYRSILARFIHVATEGGIPQAVFLEGELSNDGSLQQPRFGLLTFIVSEFDPQKSRDVVFVPVGLNYDRVLEDRMLTAEISHKDSSKKRRFNFLIFSWLFIRNLWFKYFWRQNTYGYGCVSIGRPISLHGYLRHRGVDFRRLDTQKRDSEIERLGLQLINEVGRVVPALPVTLVASAVMQTPDQWISELEIKSRIFEIIKQLESVGAHFHIPRMDRDQAVSEGLHILTSRRLIGEKDGIYLVNPNEKILLSYYANAITHLLPSNGNDKLKSPPSISIEQLRI